MYSTNRDAYRQAYFAAWQKYQKKLLLEPLEVQIIEVILRHPEYHSLLEKTQPDQNHNFDLEENPFFHLGLHLSIQDQIKTNRPYGITAIYEELLQTKMDGHTAQHLMMNCLAQTIWQTQQDGLPPDENTYLEKLRKL